MHLSEQYRHQMNMARWAFWRACDKRLGKDATECDPGLELPESAARSVMADVVHAMREGLEFHQRIEEEEREEKRRRIAALFSGSGLFFGPSPEAEAHTAPGVESVSPERGAQAPPVERKRAKKGRAA